MSDQESIDLVKQMNEVVKQKRPIAELEDHEGLWNGAVNSVDKMPDHLKADFVKFIGQRVKEEPEKDQLAREITQILESIKADWAKFDPVDWTRDSLDSLGRDMRCVWDLMGKLEKIEKGEREWVARKQALDVWDNGCQFSEIKLDGFRFVMNGGNIVPEAPGSPDDIPF